MAFPYDFPPRTPGKRRIERPVDAELVLADPLLSAAGRRQQLGGISEMTAWRWERDFGLPGPDVVIGKRRFWRSSTINSWIDQRIAKS